MRDLLFLSHRIPYPPNKGDKVRAWHFLQHLAVRYRVHLGCFIDDDRDWQHVPFLRDICVDTCFVALRPQLATLRGLGALFRGSPITLLYYFDAAMAEWAHGVLKRSAPIVFVYSSAMAQYALNIPLGAWARIIDFVDVDSEKWRDYAARKPWPVRFVYRREANTLRRFERRIAQEFDASIFVSEAEMKMFRRIAPESAENTFFVRNGVDSAYFSRQQRYYPNPYAAHEEVICFTGMMDYWPNIDAVKWFAVSVLPVVQKKRPNVSFCIVGANPAPAVRRLANRRGIMVIGRVADIRPYIAHAAVTVAPLRIARGIQNKILEAMAMGKVVVATPQALEGMDAEQDRELLVAATEEQMAASVERVLDGGVPRMGERARLLMEQQYAWPARLTTLDRVIQDLERRAASAREKDMAHDDLARSETLSGAIADVSACHVHQRTG